MSVAPLQFLLLVEFGPSRAAITRSINSPAVAPASRSTMPRLPVASRPALCVPAVAAARPGSPSSPDVSSTWRRIPVRASLPAAWSDRRCDRGTRPC